HVATALRPHPRHADPVARRRSRAVGHRLHLVGVAALADRSVAAIPDARGAHAAPWLRAAHRRREGAHLRPQCGAPLRRGRARGHLRAAAPLARGREWPCGRPRASPAPPPPPPCRRLSAPHLPSLAPPVERREMRSFPLFLPLPP